MVGEDATLSEDSITIEAGDSSGSVTLTVEADATHDEETVTVVATGTGIDGDLQIPITVLDPEPLAALTVTVSAAPMEIEEGETSTITAMANRNVEASDGTVTVNLSVVGDATLSANSITIAAGENSGTVMLTSTEDNVRGEDDETVTVTASGTGITGNQEVEITVTDDDAPIVPPDLNGQIRKMELTGGSVEKKTIGNVTRYHVPEGATDVELEVEVSWTHEEITALYGAGTTAAPAIIDVQIWGRLSRHQTGFVLPNWVSWIDEEGRTRDFPQAGDYYDGAV